VTNQIEDLRLAGIEAEVFGFDGRASWTLYLRAAKQLHDRLRMGTFDLIHAHYGLTGAAAILGQPRVPRVPLVTTFHGSDAYVNWQRLMSRWTARRSTCICVSQEIARLIGNEGASVIPMGVDTDLFRPMPRSEARRALGLEESGTYLLFPGQIRHPAKRYELFEAVADELRTKTLTLDGHPHEKVPLLLNAADVVLMTSRHEGSPLTIREALAVETPVVSVAVGDVPQTLNGLPGCEIVEPDPTSLANGVRRALAEPRSRLLRQRAEESSRPVVARKVIDVYHAVLGRDILPAQSRF